MTTKLVALVLLCLMTGTAMAQEAKVTPLMSKDLTENPGKEALMITVEYPPGSSDPIHRHNAQRKFDENSDRRGERCDRQAAGSSPESTSMRYSHLRDRPIPHR